jgi:apolipoprotein N-acyltransferase
MNRKIIVLIIVSSVLYILAFPYCSISILSFISVIPFFIVIEKSNKWKTTFFAGLMYGVLIGAGLSYWLYPALHYQYGISGVFSILFVLFFGYLPFGLLFAFFAVAYKYLYRNSLIFYICIVPSLWIVIEYLRELVPIMVPWGAIGYSVVNLKYFVQISDIIGVYGVSFLIVLINSTLTYVFLSINIDENTRVNRQKQIMGDINITFIKKNIIPILLLVIIITFPQIYGYFSIRKWERIDNAISEDAIYRVSIIQGNFGNTQRWRSEASLGRLDTYISLSFIEEAHKAERGNRIIIWPETVLNEPTMVSREHFARLMIISGRDALLISGGTRRSYFRGMYNTAYFISGKGNVKWYDKNILLPFSEAHPIGLDLLGKFYEAPNEFLVGKTFPMIRTDFGKIGVSICFETIYPWFIRTSVHKGSEFLVNISNDSWFGNSSEPYQHLGISVFRAIENRRYMLRASNSGISAIISPTGQIFSRTELFERTGIDGHVKKLRIESFYTQHGDWILYAAIIFLVVRVVAPLFLFLGCRLRATF